MSSQSTEGTIHQVANEPHLALCVYLPYLQWHFIFSYESLISEYEFSSHKARLLIWNVY